MKKGWHSWRPSEVVHRATEGPPSTAERLDMMRWLALREDLRGAPV